jgi:hypothetical protein
MDEKEFCKKIMCIIGPWEISKIATNELKKRVDVYLDYSQETGICPECGKSVPLYDKREERIWRLVGVIKPICIAGCRVVNAPSME